MLLNEITARRYQWHFKTVTLSLHHYLKDMWNTGHLAQQSSSSDINISSSLLRFPKITQEPGMSVSGATKHQTLHHSLCFHQLKLSNTDEVTFEKWKVETSNPELLAPLCILASCLIPKCDAICDARSLSHLPTLHNASLSDQKMPRMLHL